MPSAHDRTMRSEPAGPAATLLYCLGLGPRTTPWLSFLAPSFPFWCEFRLFFPRARARRRRRRPVFPVSARVRRRRSAAACVVLPGTWSQVCTPSLHVCLDCINILLIWSPSSPTSVVLEPIKETSTCVHQKIESGYMRWKKRGA